MSERERGDGLEEMQGCDLKSSHVPRNRHAISATECCIDVLYSFFMAPKCNLINND